MKRKKTQRDREAASGGPGMYDTSLANGSKSLNAGTSTNSVNAKRGGFARTERFHIEKPRRKVIQKKNPVKTITTTTTDDDGDISMMNIDEDLKDHMQDSIEGSHTSFGWHAGTKDSEGYTERDYDEYEYEDEYSYEQDEGKREVYEGKRDSGSPVRRRKKVQTSTKNRSKVKNINSSKLTTKPVVNPLDFIHPDDILEQEGAASELLAPRGEYLSEESVHRVYGSTVVIV